MFYNRKAIKMDGQKKLFVRFQNPMYNDPTLEVESGLLVNLKRKSDRNPNGLHNKVDKVEGDETNREGILDPTGKAWNQWNGVFLCSCLAALFIDPLFFYLPVVDDSNICLKIDTRLAIIITLLRTITDIFHLVHIAVSFRTGYIASSSRILGRGELIVNPWRIAKRYLSKHFILDVIAVLPLPQVVIWAVIPHLQGTTADNTKNALRFIILIQLIPRVYPLIQQLGKTSKIVTETAWAGAAYNLVLYMLVSHFFGACYYLLAVERKDTCWRQQCDKDCNPKYFDCSVDQNGYVWNSTDLQLQCSANGSNDNFDFGIYSDSIQNGIISTNKFVDKYFYCLWFGLRNLSTLGQGLETSSYDGEVIFSIIIVIVGLTLFAQLLGKMQTYLQSLTVKFEEMRLKRRDMEQWMQHRQIDPKLREQIRKYEQYKWLETRGVNEEEVVQVLPKDLRRDIKRHLCLHLVKKVDLFAIMDEQLIDAICERLQPTLFTPGTDVMREGDPVNEMLFIFQGYLKSTTNGGSAGLSNVGKLGPGLFCGEELLTWALDPKSGGIFPYSVQTITAETDVEAFALKAEDLKFVATRFRRLQSKQVQHKFRYYSQRWRIWATCSIQAAWRRYQRRKLDEARRKEETMKAPIEQGQGSANFGTALLVSRFAVNAMRGVHRLRNLHAGEERLSYLKLQKPAEPDFSVEDMD